MEKEIYNDGKYRAVVVCGWNDTEEETKEAIRLAQIKQTVFRQTVEEFEQLKNDAHAHRMNISEYIRWLIEKERMSILNGGNNNELPTSPKSGRRMI